ncbi:MAG: hypothetical protein R2769_06245 [Saprospiraceae bacterium]
MTNETQHWSQDDFLAFVTIYGACADMDFSDDEKAWIKEQFGDSAFEKARHLYKHQSDYENIQTIIELKKKFFPGEHGHNVLVSTLKKLFSVDHDTSRMEKLVLLGLEKLI